MLASLRVENDSAHPMQSSLANAPKSATCYVYFIPEIFFDPEDPYLTIFQKNFKNYLTGFFQEN